MTSARRAFGVIVAVLAAAGACPAAPALDASAAGPSRGGHLTIAGQAEVGSPWTPAAMRCDAYCFVRARTFFDTLAAFGRDQQVHGLLAESIEPNEDYTEWTITVRGGISFTDGTPLDADAVIYNLQDAAAGVVTSGFLKDVAKVPDPDRPGGMRLKIDKLDEMSFVIYTGSDGDPERPLPWRTLPHLLTGQWGLIASPRWLEAVVGDPALASQPVGTGPFIVDNFEPRGTLEVSRNPDYWLTDVAGRQLPYLDSITFRVIEDPETSVEALQAGDIDLVSTSNGVAITRIQDLGGEFRVTEQERFVDTQHLLIDLDKAGPLQDRRVRCAMSLAIDREEFIQVTDNGFSTAANGPFSPGQQGHLEDNGLRLEQNLAAARAMIDEYESESGEEVGFTLGHTTQRALALGAELLLGWWSEIGIEVNDRSFPQDAFIGLAFVGAPEFQVFIWREHDGVLVDQQHVWWHSENASPDGEPSINLGRLRDPAIDASLDAARTANGDDEATTAAEAINRTFAQECYSIPLSWTPWAVLSDRRVAGLGDVVLPDGSPVLEAAGLNGQFWAHTLYLADG